MGSNLGTLTLDLIARIGGFTGPLDKAERASKKNAAAISKHQQEITGAIGSSLKSLAGWAAGFIAFGAMKSFVKNSLDAAGAIKDVAATAGVTTDTLQELRHATSMFGVSAEETDANLQKFGKSIGELRNGSGSLYTYLSKNDKALLSQVQSAKSADDALNIIFESMKDVADVNERSSLAAAAFGKSGARMAIVADEYANLRKEARDLGLVIESGLIESADEAGDKLDTMAMVIKTQLTSAVLELAPVIQKTAEQIIKLSQATARFFNVKTVDEIDVEIAALEELRSEYKQTEDTLSAMKAQKGHLLPGELDQLSQAKNNIETLTESIKELNGTKMGAGTSDGGGDAALSQQQSVEIYKKAFSELEQITQKTYDVMKSEYQSDRDEFISLTGDKLTAMAIYNKKMEALSKKLKPAEGGDTGWVDSGKIPDFQKRGLELIRANNLEMDAEKDRLADKEIQRMINLQQLTMEAEDAELNSLSDSIDKEIKLHELKFSRLKSLYLKGSEELVQIERIEKAERQKIESDDLAMRRNTNSMIVQSVGASFDMMSSLAKDYAGEQSAIYKALFLIAKGFALADAIINLNMVISKATASAPPPYNIPAIAAAAIQGAIPVANIVATTFAGMAHDGIDSVPETGTWLLKKGERVVTSKTSQRLDSTLSRLQGSGDMYGGGSGVNRGLMAPVETHQHIHYDGPVFLNRAHMRDAAKLFEKESSRERTRIGAVN